MLLESRPVLSEIYNIKYEGLLKCNQSFPSPQVLGQVTLPADMPMLSRATWLADAELQRVAAIDRLLDQLPCESSAVITSANTLLSELFSHKGE